MFNYEQLRMCTDIIVLLRNIKLQSTTTKTNKKLCLIKKATVIEYKYRNIL